MHRAGTARRKAAPIAQTTFDFACLHGAQARGRRSSGMRNGSLYPGGAHLGRVQPPKIGPSTPPPLLRQRGQRASGAPPSNACAAVGYLAHDRSLRPFFQLPAEDSPGTCARLRLAAKHDNHVNHEGMNMPDKFDLDHLLCMRNVLVRYTHTLPI